MEEELRYYQATKRELALLRRDLLQGTAYHPADDNGWIRGGVGVPEPEQRTIALLENRRIQRLEAIVAAIEAVSQELTKEQQRLVQLLFWTHPQTLTMEGIAQKMHLSRRTLYRKKEDVLVMLGEKLGYI